MAVLHIQEPGRPARTWTLKAGVVRLGREPGNPLVIEDAQVSRCHAQITHGPEGIWLEDLGSANGVWMKGARITKVKLQNGDVFRVGDTELRLEVGGARPVARRKKPFPVWILGLALLLPMFAGGMFALLLYRDSGRWDLLGAQALSVARNGWTGRLRPALPRESGVPAVDVRPDPALRIVAPAHALDRARTFQAARLDADRLVQAFSGADAPVGIPLAGFELHAGMGPEDRFRHPATLSMDLQQLKIPKPLWKHLFLARVDDQGHLTRLASRVEGVEVRAEFRSNSFYILVWGPPTIVALLALWPVKDQYVKGGFMDRWYDDVGDRFTVAWPKAMGYRNSPEVAEVRRTLEDKKRFYLERKAFTQPGQDALEERRIRLAEFEEDPEVRRCGALIDNLEWKLRHLYPAQVSHAVDALLKAGDYLWTQRKFAHREGRIEAFVLDPWGHADNPDVYALTQDECFTYPYIHFNGEKIPRNYPALPADEEALDNLKTTALHEVFHVVQKEYFNTTKYLNPLHATPGGSRYEWFNEATALVLEEEAKSFYLSKGWVKAFKLSFEEAKGGYWGLFKLPLDASGARESETRQKGYGASRFLLELRTRYYLSREEAFLPTLMSNFGSFMTGPVDALVKTTSQSEAVLASNYHEFCTRNAYVIASTEPMPTPVALGRDKARFQWPWVGPLSSPCLRIKWPGLSDKELAQARLLIRHPKAEDSQVFHQGAWMHGVNDTTFQTLSSPYTVIGLKASGVVNLGAAFYTLQRVESYVGEKYLPAILETRQTTVLLLLPPKEPPTISFEAATSLLRVKLPPSSLWKEGEVRQYQVKIHNPAGGKPLTFGLDPGKDEAAIPWRQIFEPPDEAGGPGVYARMKQKLPDLVSLQDLKDMMAVWALFQAQGGASPHLLVSYREVLKGDPSNASDPDVEGPESPIFRVPVDGAALARIQFGASGTWKGQVMLAHLPVTLQFTAEGGTFKLGSEQSLPFTVGTDPSDGSIVLNIQERVNGKLMPTGASFNLRRLPGRRLWCSAPPVVLYPEALAVEEKQKQGWLDWLMGGGGK